MNTTSAVRTWFSLDKINFTKLFDKELKTHVLMMFKEVNEDNLSIRKKKVWSKKSIMKQEIGGSERKTNRDKKYKH